MKELKDLTAADFEPLVNKEVEVQTGEGTEAWTLVRVDKKAASPGTPAGCRKETFSLIFKGGSVQTATQGTVSVKMPDADDLHVFMVPLGPATEETTSNGAPVPPDKAQGAALFQAVFT